jgi:hypothetical protein
MKGIKTKLIKIRFEKLNSLASLFQAIEKKLIQEKKEPLRVILIDLNLKKRESLFLVSFIYERK